VLSFYKTLPTSPALRHLYPHAHAVMFERTRLAGIARMAHVDKDGLAVLVLAYPLRFHVLRTAGTNTFVGSAHDTPLVRVPIPTRVVPVTIMGPVLCHVGTLLQAHRFREKHCTRTSREGCVPLDQRFLLRFCYTMKVCHILHNTTHYDVTFIFFHNIISWQRGLFHQLQIFW